MGLLWRRGSGAPLQVMQSFRGLQKLQRLLAVVFCLLLAFKAALAEGNAATRAKNEEAGQ